MNLPKTPRVPMPDRPKPDVEVVCDFDLPPWHKSRFKHIIHKDRRHVTAKPKWNGKREGDPQLPFSLETRIRPKVLMFSAAAIVVAKLLLH
jgi:hypothetical protein